MHKALFDTGLKGTNKGIIQDGVYAIATNDLYNQVLSIVGKSSNQESSLNFSKKTNEAHQLFFIKYDTENDCYTIIALNSYLYLGVDKKEDSKYNNSLILLKTSTKNSIIYWNISYDDGYQFQLKGCKYNLQYIEETKTALLVKTNKQKFFVKTFDILGSGLYYISSISPGNSFLTFSKDGIQEQSFLNSRDESYDQLFYIFFDENDGCYSIINTNNQKCLSPGKNPQSSSDIKQMEYFNLDYQKWIIGTNDFKSYFLILKSDHLLLCNSTVSKNLNLFLKEFNNTLTFNCYFQFQSPNDSLYKKLKSSLGFQNLNYIELINKIKEIVKFRYYDTIMEYDLLKMVQKNLHSQLLENSFILKHLEIPLSIITVDKKALSNCLHIKFIKCHPKWLKFLPNPLNVENIVIQDGVEFVDSGSFQNFNNLKYLSIPSSLKFENCDHDLFNEIYGLKVYEGDPIFLNIIQKDELSTLNIPFYVKEIPENICAGCESLKEVHIEKNSMLEIIKSNSFAGCKLLRYMSIPESVTNISPDAFKGCNDSFELHLTNINQEISMTESLIIKSDILKITDDYKRYINITSIEIPIEVQDCQTQVLKSFEKLKTVKCHPKWFNSFNTNKIENVSIPKQITCLKRHDFENLVHLRLIEIPETVEEIERGTFDNCAELTSIKCGTKHFKFLNKKQFKCIFLNEEVEEIHESDFDGFINLEKCAINASTGNVNRNTFTNCKKLMDIEYPNGKSFINNIAQIENGITEIHKEDFDGWTNLKILVIPQSVNKIEEYAFKDCINIKYLTCDPKWFDFIPKKSIRKLVIPDYIKEINKEQFYNFDSLTYIRLPRGININDPTIFDSCENLKIIKCKSSVFNKLTDRTIERCDSKLKVKYENPIFNFQPDASKVFDEAGLVPINDNDLTSSNNYLSYSLFSSSRRNANKSIDFTIDELVLFDGVNVNHYKNGIKKVLWYIQSGKAKLQNNSKKSTINGIANVCGYICYEISQKYKIIPRVVQIYAILRLADEILNMQESKGSICEIKPGEGKSLIMAILTIILVQYNRKIDIVTSNLNFAQKYKEEQSKLFDLFQISTDILYDKRIDSDFMEENTNYKHPSYSNNFDEYDFNFKAFDCPVVYSTNRNFEYYYLNVLFSMKPMKREFDIVLIDGVDNMLIDELDSPSMISEEINYAFSSNIMCIAFSIHLKKVSEIIKILKQEFPNSSDFNEHEIELLKNAAHEAMNKTENVDYIKDDKITIIDHNTGYKMPNSHWPKYVLQMVEIKEGIIPSPISLSFCQITQHAYFKLYKKIAGITGTLGSISDENLLKEGYEVKTFRVPRNIPSDVEVYYKKRPDSINEVFSRVNDEIFTMTLQKKRPLLVIWDTKDNAENFMKNTDLENVECIFGVDKKKDKISIELAGNIKRITITTSMAIRGIDIILTEEALKVGGLHIVIPMKITNMRSLEQHFAITGRQGQPGSVTLFISSEDQYIKTQTFNQKNVNLDVIQNLFVKDIKKYFPWIFCGPKKFNFGENVILPFAANYSDIFNIFSRQIFLIIHEGKESNELNLFQDLCWRMVQTAWESFFTNIQNDKLNNDNLIYCEREYKRFTKELNNFISFKESKSLENALNFLLKQFDKEKNNEHLCYKGFKISSSNVALIHIKNKLNDNLTLESIQNQEKEKSKNKSFFERAKESFLWVKDQYYDNRNRLPKILLLTQTPKIEISKLLQDPSILNIDFIKESLKLAQEAYSGKFSIGRMILASEENDIFKPKFYCIEHLNILFVATRGSKSDEDWITDFMCEEICENINGTDIYFHKGFLMAAKYILSNISEFLNRNYEKICFVGHSYAAAVSNVLCLLTKMSSNSRNKKFFSLAFAPPPSMSIVPAYVQDCMFSFINKNDIIPHVSINNIKNTLSFEGTTWKNFIESKLIYIKALKYASEYAQRMANFIEKYKEQIYSILDSVNNDFHVHKNIGNIFIIGIRKSTNLKSYQVDETDLKDVLFFDYSMFSDHSIHEYIKSFDIITSY